jgi:hypothetical protein
MHNILCEPSKPAPRLVNRRGATIVAVLLLSLGVGASTAAFTLLNGVMPHSAPFVTCETTIEYTGDRASMPSSMPTLNVPAPADVQERISDAYETSYEAAGDAVDSWSDGVDQVDEVGDVGDVGSRMLASLLGAGALALLVVCTRGAGRALATSGGSALYVGVALGALPVAALLASAFGLPAIGFRAVAFMMTVSVVAAYWARRAGQPQTS